MKKNTIFSAMLAIVASCMSFTVLAQGNYVPKIITGVVKADSWTMNNNKEGIYQLEVKSDGQLTRLSTERDVYAAPLGGAVYQDGTMYGIHFKQEWDPYDQANTYIIYSVAYDMENWTRKSVKVLSNLYGNLISSCGITHDPVSGLNYGIFFNFNMNYQVIDRKLATIDFVNTEASGAPKKQVIDAVAPHFAAIAASENGFLYGVGSDGWLYIIGKDDAYLVPIGDLQLSDISTNPASMTFDPRTGKLYFAYVTTLGKSRLYEIDYTIGSVSATKVMDVPDNAVLVNMYISPMAAADNAPAKVEELKAQFEGESTTGTVSFKMPTTTYMGQTITGQLSYTITADGKSVATGTAAAGASVEKQVTVQSDGKEVEIKVYASNSNGNGAPATTSLYIGLDTPLPPTAVVLNYDAQAEQATLTWKAPTTGLNGKTLTPASLTYNVYKMPEGQKVASALKATTLSQTVANTGELKSFYYEVEAVNGSHVGDRATSNNAAAGTPLTPPFSEDFTTKAGFDRFIVIDNNHDGATWTRYSRYSEYTGQADYARIDAAREQADDDYLLTPPLVMQKGGRYAFKFEAKKQYATPTYDQKVRVLVGTGTDVSTYREVLEPVTVDDVNFQTYSGEVTIEEDGVYHIAFHAQSNANSGALDINLIQVNASLAATAPSEVTNARIVADPDGELKATAVFNAPLKDLRGDDLTKITAVWVTTDKDILVGQVSNPTPGQECSVKMNNLKAGDNTYYIIPVLNGNQGPKVDVTAFIGMDIPQEPTSVKLADNGSTALLTWQAPQLGMRGNPIKADKVKYNLYNHNDDGTVSLIKADIKSPYDTQVKVGEGEQRLLYYVIDAETTGGLSDLVVSNSIVAGEPYKLPYTDSFAGDNQSFVWMEGDYADWNLGLTHDVSSDDDGAAIVFVPNRADYAFFNLGKISLAGAENPVLKFKYYAMPATSTATLGVAIDQYPQGNATTVKAIDYKQETEIAWKEVTVSLKDYVTAPYIIVKFAMVSLQTAENKVPIVIDEVKLLDDLNTAISATGEKASADQHFFDLQGRKTIPSTKGIYITNGRKVVVK